MSRVLAFLALFLAACPRPVHRQLDMAAPGDLSVSDTAQCGYPGASCCRTANWDGGRYPHYWCHDGLPCGSEVAVCP